MKKSKIVIAATAIVLAVGGFYGAKAMKNWATETDYYIDPTLGCTAITCSTTDLHLGSCSDQQLYQSNVNGVCTTQITAPRYKPTTN